MAVLGRRVRQVAFRISEDEYAHMVDLCSSTGARSISDLARLAVVRLATPYNHQSEAALARHMRTLEDCVVQLDRRLNLLLSMMGSPSASSASEPESASGGQPRIDSSSQQRCALMRIVRTGNLVCKTTGALEYMAVPIPFDADIDLDATLAEYRPEGWELLAILRNHFTHAEDLELLVILKREPARNRPAQVNGPCS